LTPGWLWVFQGGIFVKQTGEIFFGPKHFTVILGFKYMCHVLVNMKGKVKINDVELDWKAREVLFVVHASDGESHTSEIRQTTDFHAEIVKYRFDRLEEAGLIEIGEPEPLDDGRMGPTPVQITSDGVDVVQEGFTGENHEKTLEERLQRIERRSERYEDIREELHRLRTENEELQDRVDELERKMEQMED
jgi:predicted MarR family transcription regulator